MEKKEKEKEKKRKEKKKAQNQNEVNRARVFLLNFKCFLAELVLGHESIQTMYLTL